MNNETWAVILGLIVTLVATFIKRASWQKGYKILLVIAISVALGVIQEGVSAGAWSWTKMLADVGIIVATSQAIYNLIWEHIEPAVAPYSHASGSPAAPVAGP